MNEQKPPSAWHFGDCTLDAARRELRRDGVVVEVQPRVFDLLVYLAQHRERAVDKDELQNAVWPGMFITETALTRAVMKARKAVGDDASTQAVIKTIHGHGYRFVAEPNEAPVEAPNEAPVEAGPVQPRAAPARRRWLPALLASAALVVAALTWFVLRPPPAAAGGARIAILPLDDRTGNPELAWARLGLMSYAGTLVAADDGIEVVPEGSVVSLAEGLGWSGSLDDPATSELLDRLRKVFGASYVLAMSLEPDGRALRMDYKLSGPDERQRRGTMVGDQPTDLAEGVVQSVYDVLLGKRHKTQDVPLVSADPFNNEAFARGMDLALQGRCAEAVSFFRLILEQEPGLQPPRYEYASCLRILGENDEAERLLDELITELEAVGPSRALAQALMTRGVLYNRTGRLDAAEAGHRRALAVAEQLGEQELAGRILQNLSIVFSNRGDWKQAWELLDLATLAYQQAGREVMPGQLFSGKANLLMAQGKLSEARAYLDQALQAFREVGDRHNEAMMLNNTGYLLRNMGQLEEAEDYHLRSLRLREEIGDRVGMGRVYGMLSVVYTAQGRYPEAVEASQAAVAIARETRDRLYEGTSLAQLADAELAQGDSDAARHHYEEGRAVFEAIQDRMRVLQSDLKLARLELERGDSGLAEASALEVLQEARELGHVQPEIEALELLGDAALARGDDDAALAEYAAALQRVRESSWGAKEHELLVKQASVLLERGELEAVAPLVGALAAQPDDADGLRIQARYAGAAGDTERAAGLLERARQLAGQGWTETDQRMLEEWRGE